MIHNSTTIYGVVGKLSHMPRMRVRSTVPLLLAVLLLLSGIASPVLAAPNDEEEETKADTVEHVESLERPTIELAYAGTNKAAATRVRKAFLQAKKAFHEARQEIQAIKKGDESPVEDVPSFFESEDDD